MNTTFFALLFYLLTAKHQILDINGKVLSTQSFSLKDRYPQPTVNDIFKKNILLTLDRMKGDVVSKPVDLHTLDKPFVYSITLHKNEVFAFHNQVLPEFSGKVVATTNSNFSGREGFASDGYLFGDGVCHLASLIDYAAQKAGLRVVAPSNHDFAAIPDVPKKYGVGIYTTPDSPTISAKHNLYVENTKNQDVDLVFDYSNNTLRVSVVEL